MESEKKSIDKITSFKNFFSKVIKSALSGPEHLLSVVKKSINDLKSLRDNLNDLTNSNIKIGMYHMENKNWKDAIFRFKFVKNFLDKDNKDVLFYLSWCYLFQGDLNKALESVNESLSAASGQGEVDDENQEIKRMKIILKDFIEKIDEIKEIPEEIEVYVRNIIADHFLNKFDSNGYYLPTEFVNELNKHIIDFPEKYSVLELGANIGLLSLEMRKRLPDQFKLLCIESSNVMSEFLQNGLDRFEEKYSSSMIVEDSDEEGENEGIFSENEVRCELVRDYLNDQKDDKLFDLIVSLEGLNFTSNLEGVFKKIYQNLIENGNFAFTSRIKHISSGTNSSIDKTNFEFVHTKEYLEDCLEKAGFVVETDRIVELGKNNLFCIFIARK